MRLLSYNVHKCVGGLDRRWSPLRVAEAILPYAPEIVLLQEVVVGARTRAVQDQVAFLGEALGLRHRAFFPQAPCRGGGFYGNAILSRHPLMTVTQIDLKIPLKKRRGALHALVRQRRGPGRVRTLHVYNLHLGLSGIERRLQLRRFLASRPFAGFHHRTPVVVGGDFNDFWGVLGRQILEPAGFHGLPRRPRTFPAAAPVRALDAFYARALKLSLAPVPLPRAARFASDHRPLAVDAHFAVSTHVRMMPKE